VMGGKEDNNMKSILKRSVIRIVRERY
jgi:hypothetical protein